MKDFILDNVRTRTPGEMKLVYSAIADLKPYPEETPEAFVLRKSTAKFAADRAAKGTVPLQFISEVTGLSEETLRQRIETLIRFDEESNEPQAVKTQMAFFEGVILGSRAYTQS